MRKIIVATFAALIGVGFAVVFIPKYYASRRHEKDEAELKQKRYSQSNRYFLDTSYQMAEKARVERVNAELSMMQEKDTTLEYLKNEAANARRLSEHAQSNILEIKAEQRAFELNQRNSKRKQLFEKDEALRQEPLKKRNLK
jgi:hypothetical protein